MGDQMDSSGAGEDKSADTHVDLSQKQTGETGKGAGNSLAGDALAQLALQDPKAAETLRRHFQSRKDKGVQQANKMASEAMQMVQAVADRLGIDPQQVKQAQRDIILDKLIEDGMGGNSFREAGGQTDTETDQKASSNNIAAAFAESGWDMTRIPKEDFEFAKSFKGNQAALSDALLERRITSQAADKDPSPAATSVTGGQSAKNMPKEAALKRDYEARITKLRQEYRGTIPVGLLADLKAEFRRKGLKIH